MVKFKLGDWVTYNNQTPFQIKDIFTDGHTKHICDKKLDNPLLWDTGCYSGKFQSDSCKPWQPKLNEWCWFLTIHAGYVLGQYVGRSGTNFKYKLNMSSGAIFNCSNCEPFIGQLPTQLTGK